MSRESSYHQTQEPFRPILTDMFFMKPEYYFRTLQPQWCLTHESLPCWKSEPTRWFLFSLNKIFEGGDAWSSFILPTTMIWTWFRRFCAEYMLTFRPRPQSLSQGFSTMHWMHFIHLDNWMDLLSSRLCQTILYIFLTLNTKYQFFLWLGIFCYLLISAKQCSILIFWGFRNKQSAKVWIYVNIKFYILESI